MAKTTTITVRVKCKPNGGFSVSVDDWQHKVKKADDPRIEWDLQAQVENGQPTAVVKWMRIENPFSSSDWPFTATPPDATYIAKPGANAKSGSLKAGWVPDPNKAIRYTITICFSDAANSPERYAYIDPDMVIDI